MTALRRTEILQHFKSLSRLYRHWVLVNHMEDLLGAPFTVHRTRKRKVLYIVQLFYGHGDTTDLSIK